MKISSDVTQKITPMVLRLPPMVLKRPPMFLQQPPMVPRLSDVQTTNFDLILIKTYSDGTKTYSDGTKT